MTKFQEYVKQEFLKALTPDDLYGCDAVDELLEDHPDKLIRWVHQAWVSKVGEKFYLSKECGNSSKERFERFIADIPNLTKTDLSKVLEPDDISKVIN